MIISYIPTIEALIQIGQVVDLIVADLALGGQGFQYLRAQLFLLFVVFAQLIRYSVVFI